MSHVLVRWIAENQLDVRPIRALQDEELVNRVMTNADAIGPLRGSVVMVKKSAKEAPAQAMIIDAGPENIMEKRRSWLVSEAASESRAHQGNKNVVLSPPPTTCKKRLACHSDEPCECQEELEGLREEVERLRQENATLKKRLEDVETTVEATKMVKRLRHMLRDVTALQLAADVVPVSKTHIGNGVLVDATVLKDLRDRHGDAPCRFARALLRVLFPDGEWRGKSLSGRPSNAHKSIRAKEQLDPIRITALLSYTCTELGGSRAAILGSLSSMLSRKEERAAAAAANPARPDTSVQ